MAVIVIPLMIAIEIFQDLNLLDKLTRGLNPLSRLLNISREANLPIMAGLFFGISYGGGIIIHSATHGKLTSRDIYIINIFLVICHSIFEDTLVFAAIGAVWIPLLGFRILLAVLTCWCIARLLSKKKPDMHSLIIFVCNQ